MSSLVAGLPALRSWFAAHVSPLVSYVPAPILRAMRERERVLGEGRTVERLMGWSPHDPPLTEQEIADVLRTGERPRH